MVRAADAIEVDSTGLAPEQVVDRIVALAAGARA
jgi:cytidylate kinase